MSARQLRRGKGIREELERRGYGEARSSPTRSKGGTKMKHPARANGISRRQFLGYGAGGGMMLGLSPLLVRGQGSKGTARSGAVEVRTLFFNFSHEDFEHKTYFLV